MSLPTPPSSSRPTTFNAESDAFLGALPNFETDMNADRATAVAKASEAAASAVAAAASAASATAAANVTKWVGATSYTEGAGVWSPLQPGQSYRRLAAGSPGAFGTDPSLDVTHWTLIGPTPSAGATSINAALYGAFQS